MAALCHDVGHLPFSHAAEHELLPDGWDHERLTVELIRSPLMEDLWRTMTPPLRSLDIAKLAVGKKKLKDESFSDWEALLSEIIVHDAFGVDRMDYLLRDSLHAGVAYGRFDHFRLIDTLRLLPSSLSEDGSEEPQVGIEEGGLHSAEALLLARYFMFSQMYYHPVRVIYDLHLKEFLHATLPGGVHPTDLASHLARTDIDVTGEIIRAASDSGAAGHEAARRILQRQHFKVLWQRNPADSKVNLDPGLAVFAAAVQTFGEQDVRRVRFSSEWAVDDFPVKMPDGRIESAQALSHVLGKLPPIAFDYVFVNPDIRDQAKEWLRSRREDILRQPPEEE
jgi:HD superfamily phosphohydrolase